VADRPKPNVVQIICHDLGTSLGCYGAPISTPNLDFLAREGVLFSDLYAAGVGASPSRGSLSTGCYPHTHGLMGLMPKGWLLDVDRCSPLPELLAEAGYRTHLFGFQHEHVRAERLGYGVIHEVPSYYAGGVTDAFCTWMQGRTSDDQRFFASLGFREAHRLGLNPSHFGRDVYDPEDPDAVVVPDYLPDLAGVREDLASFCGVVKDVDRVVGLVMDALGRSDLARNTLVVFTSDNGPSFMHAKCTLYDAGVRLPLLMRWPEGLPMGATLTGLVSQIDVLPTLLDLLSVPIPDGVQGQSVATQIRTGRPSQRNLVYAEKNYERGFRPMRMARSPDLKYIRKAMPACIYDDVIQELELSATGFRQNRAMFEFYSARRVTEELYDLRADPAELSNLAEDPVWSQQLATLRGALDAHMEATDDPFRATHITGPTDPESYARVRDAARRTA